MHTKRWNNLIVAGLLLAGVAPAGAADPAGEAHVVKIPGTADGTDQPAWFYVPRGAVASGKGKPAPLLVALHTWSSRYDSKASLTPCLSACRQRGWVMVHPHFRGPNWTPQACASDLAVQDILDAVAYARTHAKVDPRRIYLVGASGGGHMAMMMASRAPTLWAGVSAWVGISDLAAWHAECKKAGRKYAKDIEKVLSGPPDTPARLADARRRSPLTWLGHAKGLAVDLNVGIHDGHAGSVPVTHSLRAFNVLAIANGQPDKQLSPRQMAFMADKQEVPRDLAGKFPSESGRRRGILLRRSAGPARLTVFDGGHEVEYGIAVDWLAQQVRKTPAPAVIKPVAEPAPVRETAAE